MTTQTPQFKHLFTPLQIGPVTVRNRLMTTAHWNRMTETDPHNYDLWSVYGDRAKYYWVERSKGGWGLIIAGQTVVHPSCGVGRPSAFMEESISGYTKIARAIHKHGAKVFVQINHVGRHRASNAQEWGPAWGPSAVPIADAMGKGQRCKAMEKEDIEAVVAGFAKTAANLQEAGFDGVEIHAAHDYLLDQFLTPLHNKRTDEYGGSVENRARFLMETLDAVRRRVGAGFAVGVRLDGVWPIKNGRTLEETIEIGERLEATGQIDFINVTAWPIHLGIAPIGTPMAHLVGYAQAIKASLEKTAVFAIGRIIDPVQAEKVIAQGCADMVAMTRASIADPELPNKALAGRVNEIRMCVGASQGCLGSPGRLGCTQNATTSREKEWGIGTLKPAAVKKDVMIVGGGPAGMEAAILAARRGHHVVLYEKGDTLGGQINLIVKSPRRDEFGGVVEWRKRQLGLLGVEVKLNTDVTADLVRRLNPDSVIVATGSVPRRDGWYSVLPHLTSLPGFDLGHVYNSWDVMQGKVGSAKHVVLVDDVGYYHSSDPLEYLAARGCKVSAISAGPMFAAEMGSTERPLFIESLRRRDVTFYPSTVVNQIREDAVDITDVLTGRQSKLPGVDAVVLSLGVLPNDALYFSLKGVAKELQRIGDCTAPRGVEHAVYEGHKAGREV